MVTQHDHGLSRRIQRPVRARPEDSELEESAGSSSDNSSLGTGDEESASGAEDMAEDDDISDMDGIDQDEDALPEDLGADLGAISFGALAKAQQSLGKRKRGSKDTAVDTSSTDKLEGIRNRLHALKEEKKRKAGDTTSSRSANDKGRDKFSTSAAEKESRSSKHAPTIISSKRAVTRKREVVPVPKSDSRDPRFDTLSGAVDTDKTRKNYSFLDQYKDDEMKQLREAIKKRGKQHGGDEETDKLKRQLLSMESKKKAQDNLDQRQEVLRNHRRKEKELIQQGKKPFYLKKGEQNKLALISRYEGLKSDKQREHAMERREKKMAAKERKGMPFARRGAEGQ
ncbi:MAG: hypothetical protein M4579_000508 [Chaenotheca gracillima]|nr:MAG: hypothetical protein M4579_000508 [Chaenotheca gracillima]